ncbi:hypothetical protein D1AOALGA4SA_11824 [Olavius algarvensis Delta 1 endosymbiont]|nr:hypothetical protein D1AOALGA4SA_11824 [Olavius algarvensis Delta 1 endosymbiont]
MRIDSIADCGIRIADLRIIGLRISDCELRIYGILSIL